MLVYTLVPAPVLVCDFSVPSESSYIHVQGREMTASITAVEPVSDSGIIGEAKSRTGERVNSCENQNTVTSTAKW